MSSGDRDEPIALSIDATDAVGVLRYSLERRQFGDAYAIKLTAAQPEEEQSLRRHATFFEALSFMEAAPDQARDAVVSMLSALASAGLEIVLWVHSDGQSTRFLYGVVDPIDGISNPYKNNLLRNVLEAYLPGARIDAVPAPDVSSEHAERLHALSRAKAIARVVGIPGSRADVRLERGFAQILDGLAGTRYDLIIQCEPGTSREIDVAESGLANISNLAQALSKTTLSSSVTANFAESLNHAIQSTITESSSSSWSSTHSVTEPNNVALASGLGEVVGGALGALAGSFAPGPGTAAGAVLGRKVGGVVGNLLANPTQRSTATQTGGGQATTQGVAFTKSDAVTWGEAHGKQVSFELANRHAALLEELTSTFLDRFRISRALGLWHVSVHVLGNTSAEVEATAHVVMGALRGDESTAEPLRLLRYDRSSMGTAVKAVSSFRPPTLANVAHPFLPRGNQASTALTAPELTNWFLPPVRAAAGTLVRRAVQFARYAPTEGGAEVIQLGKLVATGRSVSTPVSLSVDSLQRHVFVAGTTGAGKTTTIRKVLHALQKRERPVPFLVIEPAKSEYRDLFETLRSEGHDPLRLVLGAASASERAFSLNPFRAPAGIPLGRHAEAMKILLRSCFDMQESLPQLLERVLFAAYERLKFTDFASPLTEEDAQRPFPTFETMTGRRAGALSGESTLVTEVVKALRYDDRVQANLIAALTVRLESFQRGLKASLFSDAEIDFDEVLERPCFLELSDLTEPDVRRFAIGSLVLRLAAEREAKVRRHGQPKRLEHLLVLEEAHHVLRDAIGTGPAAELTRTTNLVLADALAELRSFGQGILIADQAPSELLPAVVRNTSTKLIHTLYFEQDCNCMGDSIGLDDQQRGELRRLERGECVVFGPDLPLPVVCRVDPSIGEPR